jgi:hypothetical protein
MSDIMQFCFEEDRAGQAAAWLLRRNGEPMPALKLVALLYLVDRESFIESTYPLTGDEFVVAEDGPTLRTLRQWALGAPCSVGKEWKRYVQPVAEHQWGHTREDDFGALSERDCELLDVVFERHRAATYDELCELARRFPEWRAPAEAPEPIDPATILRHAGYEEVDIEEVTDLVGSVHWLHTLPRQ